MVLNKILKIEDIQENSHYFFEKHVNDCLADLAREGAYIINVRFERCPIGEQAFFFAYILYNTGKKKEVLTES